MSRPSSLGRATIAILITVVSLLLLLLGLEELFGPGTSATVGIVLAGVAPRLVDVIHDALPRTADWFTALRIRVRRGVPAILAVLRRITPRLPEQDTAMVWWSAASAVLLVQAYALPMELIVSVADRVAPATSLPFNPWWLSLGVLHFPMLGLAGYLIGRLDPPHTARNLGVALYINLFLLIVRSQTRNEFYDLLLVFGIEPGFDPSSGKAALIVAGSVAMEATARTVVTTYCALWGANRAKLTAAAS